MGSAALILEQSNFLYLTRNGTAVLSQQESLVVMGRFDGLSLILTLSAVKHLGKITVSSTMLLWVGTGFFSPSACLLLQNNPKKNAVYLGQHRESSCPLP